MAGGLNKKIGAGKRHPDPRLFLGEHIMLVPAHGLVTGRCQLDFEAIPGPGNHAQLRRFVRRSTFSRPLNSFFLKAIQDNVSQHALPNDVTFFFTDTLTGCQFLAYGPNRNSLTVEHNNSRTAGAVDFTARWNNARTFAYHIRVQRGIQYSAASVANVVGVRRPAGWRFYWQQHHAGLVAPRVDWTPP